jgi:hypothetical protein
MAPLPNPWISHSDAPSPAASDTAAVDQPGTITEPTSSTGGSQEAPAAAAPVRDTTAGATDCISEIFHYARKLMSGHRGFVLDEARFLAEIDETPLFIREDGYLRRNA